MAYDIDKFIDELERKLEDFGIEEAAELCNGLVKFLLSSDETIPHKRAEKVLQLLRSKRMFDVMQKVADTLQVTGRISLKIQRQYAQALIDSGNYTAAMFVLQDMIAKTSDALPTDSVALFENTEARGLVGRVYKQLYVNAGSPSNPKCIEFLSKAANAYYDVYDADKTKIWHGINTVALLERAKRDKVEPPLTVDSLKLAQEILDNVQTRYDDEDPELTAWDFATAAEACLALNKPKEALRWLSGYARMPKCDAFELTSTLRQMEEVWQLDLNSDMGQHLLPLLRSELMQRKGSTLTLSVEEMKAQKEVEEIVKEKYDNIVDNSVQISEGNAEERLEKVFGNDSFNTFKWLMLGCDRGFAIARIGKDPASGLGTGFLLKGKDLEESLGEELVLLTNYHVVSDSAGSAMRPKQAIVVFEALNVDEHFRNLRIHWSSPVNDLDATVLRFDEKDKERLENLTKNLKFYPLTDYLPDIVAPPKDKVYVIGHPGGNAMKVSFYDNLLIDHDKTSKLHYRTPTEPGSSGSPVFNDQWDLIGLHHKGGKAMKRLNGDGTYEANEGIWIPAIRKKMNEKNTTGQ